MLCKLTANLYSSKTDFLLIGLKQQLAKINSNSLDTVHSARNLGQARIQKARLRGRELVVKVRGAKGACSASR